MESVTGKSKYTCAKNMQFCDVLYLCFFYFYYYYLLTGQPAAVAKRVIVLKTRPTG